MQDFKLDLDDLQVQSFETTHARRSRPRGTVVGQSQLPIDNTGYNDPACNPNYTQTSSCQHEGGQGGCTSSEECQNTIGATCGAGCGEPETIIDRSTTPCMPCDTQNCTNIYVCG